MLLLRQHASRRKRTGASRYLQRVMDFPIPYSAATLTGGTASISLEDGRAGTVSGRDRPYTLKRSRPRNGASCAYGLRRKKIDGSIVPCYTTGWCSCLAGFSRPPPAAPAYRNFLRRIGVRARMICLTTGKTFSAEIKIKGKGQYWYSDEGAFLGPVGGLPDCYAIKNVIEERRKE